MFSTLSKTEIIIFVTFKFSSANAFNFVLSKTLSSVNGLKLEEIIIKTSDDVYNAKRITFDSITNLTIIYKKKYEKKIIKDHMYINSHKFSVTEDN